MKIQQACSESSTKSRPVATSQSSENDGWGDPIETWGDPVESWGNPVDKVGLSRPKRVIQEEQNVPKM